MKNRIFWKIAVCVAVISATIFIKYASAEKPTAVEAMSYAENLTADRSVTFADLAGEVFSRVNGCGI